jgi:hypothetical protein
MWQRRRLKGKRKLKNRHHQRQHLQVVVHRRVAVRSPAAKTGLDLESGQLLVKEMLPSKRMAGNACSAAKKQLKWIIQSRNRKMVIQLLRICNLPVNTATVRKAQKPQLNTKSGKRIKIISSSKQYA